MHLVDILSMPRTILGAVLGLALGLCCAYLVKVYLPNMSSTSLGALMVAALMFAGALIGSRFDKEP